MRLSLLLAATQAAAFAPPPRFDPPPTRIRSRLASSPGGGDATPAKKKVLTADDVLQKSKSLGVLGGDPTSPGGGQDTPKIFPPEIYDDFQSTLLLLERRVKEGPGCVSATEVGEFEERTGRIVREMRAYMKNPEGVAELIRKGYEATAAAAEGGGGTPRRPEGKLDDGSAAARAAAAERAKDIEETKSAESPAPPAAEAVVPPPAPAKPDPGLSSVDLPKDADDLEQGGISGYGLAAGTTNTYIIPGMEGMSGEEYRAKLQENVSARQAQRRKMSLNSGGGIIGNRSSNGYLDTLSRPNNQG